MIRLLFIGDVVGRSGRAALLEQVPILRSRWALDFIIVNGENAAGGFGLTEAIFEDFLAVGVDAVTLGNHAFDQREALVFIERQPRLIRPVNYPAGHARTRRGGDRERQGRAAPHRQCAWPHLHGRARRSFRRRQARARRFARLGEGCDASIVDFHAEATSEKWAAAHLVDGKASLVRRHPYPCAQRRSSDSRRRHRLHHRRRHDWRLRFRDRDGKGRAVAPIHAPHSLRPLRAGAGAGDPVRRRGRDRPRRPDESHRAGQDRRSSGAPPTPDFWN